MNKTAASAAQLAKCILPVSSQLRENKLKLHNSVFSYKLRTD